MEVFIGDLQNYHRSGGWVEILWSVTDGRFESFLGRMHRGLPTFFVALLQFLILGWAHGLLLFANADVKFHAARTDHLLSQSILSHGL